MAVPLFELYDNIPRYGPVIAALPHLLSRLRLTLLDGAPLALMAAAAGDREGEEAPGRGGV